MDGPCAIGRFGEEGAWVGFVRRTGAYRLAVGDRNGVRTADADAALLLALAVAYFEDALDDPPPELEATHADLSGIVRHVASQASDATDRALLGEAVDAVDDGLAVDAVVNRLSAALARMTTEQVDPVDLLLERARRLLEGD